MTKQRRAFTLLLLTGVLVASLAFAHRNNPTYTWRTSNMLGPRESQSMVILNNHSVLVVGGEGLGSGLFGDPTDTAEVFNVTSGRWKLVGSMSTPRVGQIAARLQDGRVLVAGGDDDYMTPLQSAETFSTKSGKWTPVAPMPKPASGQAATALPNGKVLVTGGIVSGTVSSQALLFNPRTNTWRMAAHMRNARAGHASVLLPDGNVLVAGGTSPHAELYQTSRNTWIPAGEPGTRLSPAAVRVGRSDVLVAGGKVLRGNCYASALLYTGGTSWHSVAPMSAPRCSPLSTSLPDGKAIVGGGFGPNTWSSLQEFNPATMRWSAFPSLPGPRSAGTMTYIDGNILAAGGSVQGSPISTAVLRRLP